MNFLTNLFIKKGEDPKTEKVRERSGKNAGVLCIILNTILAVAKILLGVISNAVSILADGFNNLTDCGSNIISVIGFKVSGKPADKEHPFGHQRAETISAFLIAMLILFVALELAIESVNKIISPEVSEFNLWLIVILSISIIVKLFMFALNSSLAKATDSESLKATAGDSVGDAISTFVVLLALLISHFFSFNYMDGIAGVGVAIFIGLTGFKILMETISHLIGEAPTSQILEDIENKVLAFQGVQGIHDLAVHSYGQNKMYATVHVEVDSNMNIMSAHELADDIEREFAVNTNIVLTVHIDPLVLDDPIINELKEFTIKMVNEVDPILKIHDFRVVGGDIHSNLVFDVSVPFDCRLSLEQVKEEVTSKILSERDNLGVVMTAERIIN